jgi:hypothetical protein
LVYVKALSRIWLAETEQNCELFGQRRFNKWTLIIQTLRYTNPGHHNCGLHRTTLLPRYYAPHVLYEPRDIVPCIDNFTEQESSANLNFPSTYGHPMEVIESITFLMVY